MGSTPGARRAGWTWGSPKTPWPGFFGGYANRSLALSAPASDNGRAETVSLGGYGSYFTDRWFVEGSLRAGLDSYHARRTVASPGRVHKGQRGLGRLEPVC